MIDLNIVNILTIGLITLLAFAGFNFVLPMVGLNPSAILGMTNGAA